jgi:hypothetical protein
VSCTTSAIEYYYAQDCTNAFASAGRLDCPQEAYAGSTIWMG